ncbi:MAG: hypothetical protein J6V47_00925 [Bacteroidaceae bacterium]|nr:hypothetical protein [Bacteroidaceae bacterium]
MKKFFGILSVVAALFVANGAQAQVTTPVFDKGDNIISATIGYGWGLTERFVYERCVASWFDGQLSVGVGAALSNATDFGTYYVWDEIGLGAVASCHYQFIDKLDTYVQVGLGFEFGYESWDSGNSYLHYGLGWTSTVGARWYFTEDLAVNGEFGWISGAYLMAGVTYKF